MASSPGQDSSVDVEALINGFLQDSSSSSLELPRSLTAAQRKQAKKLADVHPDLKCESYGFGEDRKLHLFKKDIEDPAQDRVRVKNTFIDDWEGAAGEAEDTPAFRSMPHNLLQRTLERATEAAEVHSPATESSAANSHAGTSLASSVGPELPPMPEGFKVRNTFITIEEVPAVERIVQSMPHGMFRQCLEAELSKQNASPALSQEAGGAPPVGSTTPAGGTVADSAAPVAPPLHADEQQQQLSPGTEVTIQGLVKLPDFNGLTGVVQALDAESGRYDVLLDDPAGASGWRWVKVKGENCRPRIPPPPARCAPNLVLDVLESPEGEGSSNIIPPTPKWEEDFQPDYQPQVSGVEPKPKLKLNALV